MRAVGLKVLKKKLSEYVRLAASGERILVMDRDRVVAELVPPEPHRGEFVHDALLAEAVRSGVITPPAMRSPYLPPRLPIAKLWEILAELDEDRADRRSMWTPR
jgi:antitoxin (DNA-binding transcriptional repressor) of toxin-antitoxin stability system